MDPSQPMLPTNHAFLVQFRAQSLGIPTAVLKIWGYD